jgi:hypothetical protein
MFDTVDAHPKALAAKGKFELKGEPIPGEHFGVGLFLPLLEDASLFHGGCAAIIGESGGGIECYSRGSDGVVTSVVWEALASPNIDCDLREAYHVPTGACLGMQLRSSPSGTAGYFTSPGSRWLNSDGSFRWDPANITYTAKITAKPLTAAETHGISTEDYQWMRVTVVFYGEEDGVRGVIHKGMVWVLQDQYYDTMAPGGFRSATTTDDLADLRYGLYVYQEED